jgi:hypothetical protein
MVYTANTALLRWPRCATRNLWRWVCLALRDALLLTLVFAKNAELAICDEAYQRVLMEAFRRGMQLSQLLLSLL